MANTSLTLGEHWESFIKLEVSRGRYGSASEVVRSALRELEKSEENRMLQLLRASLIEGELSETAGELNLHAIREEIKSEIGLK